jgi:hypothetical protein
MVMYLGGYMVKSFEWQSGNGTRYELLYGTVLPNDGFVVVWLESGSSGRAFKWFGDYLHYTYFKEKTGLNDADTAGILSFLKSQGHEVGMPSGFNDSGCRDLSEEVYVS